MRMSKARQLKCRHVSEKKVGAKMLWLSRLSSAFTSTLRNSGLKTGIGFWFEVFELIYIDLAILSLFY